MMREQWRNVCHPVLSLATRKMARVPGIGSDQGRLMIFRRRQVFFRIGSHDEEGVIAHMKLIWVAAFLGCAAFAAEKKIQFEDLPAAVQTAVKEQTQNATLVGLSTEKEKGKTVYEVETKVNGKSRDLLLDQAGAVVETEEEVAIETVPASAKATLQKRATGGTISKIEKVTARNTVSYEATIRTKSGKISEYAVTPEGKPVKD
jgi:uncharacterized membrane protein YkoI